MREQATAPPSKPIVWMGDSRDRISEFPQEVKKELGYGLHQAQMGMKHQNAEPLHGDLSGVMGLKTDDGSGTYRAVYIAKLAERIYVLHCFKKKSKRGISTPKADLDVIRRRLRYARETHEKDIKSQQQKGRGK